MDKSTIVQGNSAIRAFNDNGIFYGANSIKEVESYMVGHIDANKEFTWSFSNIGHSVIPISLFGYKATGVSNNNSLIIKIKQGSFTLWDINLNGKTDVLGNSFYYHFPFFVIAKNQSASVTSSVALDAIVIFGQKAHLNAPIPPQN